MGGEFVIFGDKLEQVGQKPRKKMIAAFHFDNFALECPRTEQEHYPERTGICPRLERYCRLRAATTPKRSCPAGSVADAGLRWCGGRRYQPNGGLKIDGRCHCGYVTFEALMEQCAQQGDTR